MNVSNIDLETNLEKVLLVAPQAIGLPVRAENLVVEKKIENAYDAILFIVNDLDKQPGVGVKTIADSSIAITKFLTKISKIPLGQVKNLNDPREVYFEASDGNLVECFPALVRLYAEKASRENQDRVLDILTKRFGLNESKQYTLDEIGTFYDVTRERIRQIEAKSLLTVGRILSGEFQPKDWRVCTKLIQRHRLFSESIKELGLLAAEESIQTLLESEFDGKLEKPYLILLMESMSYKGIPKTVPGFRGEIRDAWCPKAKFSQKQLEKVFCALNVVFESTQGLSLFEVTVLVKKITKRAIDNETLEMAIDSVIEFERYENSVRIKFGYLRSAADKAFRVLSTANESLHYSKICREINFLSNSSTQEYRVVTDRNITNQLVADDRFVPVGRSGKWALSTWSKVENITIADALEKVLHRNGKPMRYAEILTQLIAVRPDASEKSVKVYINDASRFTRVAQGTFALKSWRLEAAPKRVRKKSVTASDFALALRDALLVENPRLFGSVIKDVGAVTCLSEASVRQRSAVLESIIIRPIGKGRRKEVYCEDLNILISPENTKGRVLLRDLVQNEIRAILLDRPNEPMLKGDLYRTLILSVPCLKPTFYQYLDKMEGVDQYLENGLHYAVFRHIEEEKRILVDIDKYKADENIKNRLRRPLDRLTVSEIDMALFELGLLFENALREYLEKLRIEQPGIVTRKDLSKLSSMIDCAVRVGVVTRGYHLNTLREERNNRAHGTSLTVEARENLFNKGHYLADMFVKYICHFILEERKI